MAKAIFLDTVIVSTDGDNLFRAEGTRTTPLVPEMVDACSPGEYCSEESD